MGTRYKAMVKQLPLTRIKIDRSFVSEIDASCRSQSIVRAVVALCAKLGASPLT